VRFNECITEPDGSVYLIMEHVPFGDLEKRGTLKTPVALEVLVQCLEGLAYLHDAGIAHRDIKPSNIVMQSDFPVCVKIVDFGLAMESQLFKTPCTTFIFQAPEILDGNSYNHVVDIWALGIVMLYLLGRFPDDESRRFYGTKQKREFDQYVDAMYQACESLQSPLNEFIRGMLVVEPKDRWSARKCLQEIKKVQRAFSQHGQARQVLAPPPVDHDAPARGHLTVPDRYAAMDWSPASVERRPSTVGGDEMDWSPEKIKDYNLEKNLRNSR
jgi:serine/threonine protein kinase